MKRVATQRTVSIPRGYTVVPNALIRLREIKPELKMVLIYLLCMSWGSGTCRVSQQRMGAELFVDGRTIRRHLRQLANLGLVRIDSSRACNTYSIDLTAFGWGTNVASANGGADKNVATEAGKIDPRDTTISPAIQSHGYEKTNTNTVVAENSTKRDEARKALAEAGVNEPMLTLLAERCSIDSIRDQVAWMNHRKVRDKAAALISALLHNWAEPEAARVEHSIASVRDADARRAADADSLVSQIVEPNSTWDDVWSLPRHDHHALRARAERDLGGAAAEALYGREKFDLMVRKYARHLLDRRAEDRAV